MSAFDPIAEEYEAGRPGYPDALLDALEPLKGALVLEGGAGTGIATRALLGRGAKVCPFDVGDVVLRLAQRRTQDLRPVIADGAALPLRDGCADLICFAQSWHWLDEARRPQEAARVLRAGGRWAGWWSHARADGEPWFEAYWDALEDVTVARRSRRDIDRGGDLRASGLFEVGERRVFPWVREVDVDGWMTDDRSKTYIAALPPETRDALLRKVQSILRRAFRDGRM